MEKIFYIYDSNGFYVSHNYYLEPPQNSTDIPILFVFQKAKFNGVEWIEGATEEEIVQANKAVAPDEVPLWAMRNILKKRNLFDAIIGAINQLHEPLKTDALDFLEYGNFIERNSNAVLLIQQITQMPSAEVDELFIEANNIKL